MKSQLMKRFELLWNFRARKTPTSDVYMSSISPNQFERVSANGCILKFCITFDSPLIRIMELFEMHSKQSIEAYRR